MPASGRKSQRIPRASSSRMHGRELGNAEHDGPPRRPGSRGLCDLEACGVRKIDQELRLAERVLADPRDADLLDEVVPRRPRVVGGRVRGSGEEARGAGRVLHLLLECERARVRLPAGEGRLQALGEVGSDV